MRIAITGPESSGKTTISKILANTLKGTFIPEFARSYLEKRNGVYSQKDLDTIAKGQKASWNENSSEILVSDTELLVIYIWSIYKYGKVSEYIINELEHQISSSLFDHYFLCSPDIPWEEDPLRENSNDRDELMQIYIMELEKRNISYTLLEGTPQERLSQAIQHLDKQE